ncbi:MAG: hypothetical protein ACREBG_02000 [Pyrinomonadaceae bacterium]
MFFRLSIGIPELLVIQDPIPFKLIEDDNNVQIVIRPATEADSDYGPLLYAVVCEATAEIRPSKNAAPLVDAIWEKRLPEGYDVNKLPESVRKVYEEHGLIEGFDLPLSDLPNSVQDLMHKAYRPIHSGINRVIGTICWRSAQAVPIYHYYRGRMRWSVDAQEWRFSPVNAKVWMGHPPFISGLAKPNFDEILQSEYAPPFARELFREAYSQKDINSRSALVIGVAALETGVKDLIIELFPDTKWLVRHLPSPPITRILSEYFPNLRADNKQVLCPPSEMVQEIQKWIGRRNDLSHGKSADIDVDELTEFLMLVSDILYLCDYARGFDWALELIRPQTRQAFG